jgi:hypothetical protein
MKKKSNGLRKMFVKDDNTNKRQIKELILETLKSQKPETTQQLIQFIQDRNGILPYQTAELLTELEDERLASFAKPKPITHSIFKSYINSKNANWFMCTLLFALTTVLLVLIIPERAYPLTIFRFVLGSIFMLFLPGYTFLRMLFPERILQMTDTKEISNIELIAQSIGVSLVLAGMIGLALNYTPMGIRLVPITLSLLALTVIFATIAVKREFESKSIAKRNIIKNELDKRSLA